jgi:hypothetical protein
MKGELQSVVFMRDKYTSDLARQWLKDHNINRMKNVHKTNTYLRYRITDPTQYGEYMTKIIDEGAIHLIIGFK